jgi:hypothetical protein
MSGTGILCQRMRQGSLLLTYGLHLLALLLLLLLLSL